MTTQRFKPANNCKSCYFRGTYLFKDKHECQISKQRESLGYVCSDYTYEANIRPTINSKLKRVNNHEPSS